MADPTPPTPGGPPAAEGFDEEFVRAFVEESEEHLELVGRELLALDDDPDLYTRDAETVHRLFRAVHSIKGLAGMLGFSAIRELSHQTETVLDRLRKGSLAFGPSVLDALEQACDGLRVQVHAIPGGRPDGVDAAEIGRLLERASAAAPAASAADPAAESLPPPESREREASEVPRRVDERAAEEGRTDRETVRVDVARLDAVLNILGELAIERARLDETSARLQAAHPRDEAAEMVAESLRRFGSLLSDLQDVVIRTRLIPVEGLFRRMHRAVRDLARLRNREIRVTMHGADTELDKRVAEEVVDPLLHIVRNAVDHGLEDPDQRAAAGKPREGSLRLSAFQEGGRICIDISDDGRGIDHAHILARARERGLVGPDDELTRDEINNLLFLPGFSTAEAVDEVSGRGVGLDVVRRNLMRLGGYVELSSELGRGTTFALRLPLTLAILPALVVRAGGEMFAVPLASVVETLRVFSDEVRHVRGGDLLPLRESLLPLAYLDERLGLERPADRHKFFVVVLAVAERRVGLVVDGLAGRRDVVIKPLGRYLEGLPGVSGATILGEGQVVLILDPPRLLEESALASGRRSQEASA